MAYSQILKRLIIFLPLGYLWFRAIDSMYLEWSTNPQYSYGLFVPFLCLGLILRNWAARSPSPAVNSPLSTVSADGSPLPAQTALRSDAPISASQLFSFSAFKDAPISLLFLFAILLVLPARLVVAATPEWRPLQWVLALIAVGATLYYVRSIWGREGIAKYGIPIGLFLIAVPWPSPIEQPIIQHLTSADSSIVVEIMGILGIPAIQHGNIIEVGSGIVGIDEACSGIRSFQSSLMISLFLGELYRLTVARRFILLGSGIVFSFAFNVCRTSFLTWIAAKNGVGAIAQYHDPAGLAILVACTLLLWIMGLFLGRNSSKSPLVAPNALPSALGSPLPAPCSQRPISSFCFLLSIILIAWFAAIEIGTSLWFSSREAKLVIGPDWSLSFPTNEPSFKSVTITDKTFGLLRYDDGKEGTWQDADGGNWHAFYFNWVPGRVAGYLAKRHTPEICMGAAGQNLKAGPDLFVAKINDITLPIRQYLYENQGNQMHVFHCRWEAGADQNASVQYESSRLNLIRGVWAGRGNQGQKVIELIVTGYATPEQARAALIKQLDNIVKAASTKEVARK